MPSVMANFDDSNVELAKLQSETETSYTDIVPGRATLEVMGVVRPQQCEGGVVQPETYLVAGGELLAFLFSVVWLITMIFNPGVATSNPIKMKLGYNNVCVGLDSQPAKSPGQVLFVICYYVCVRYAVLNMQRSFELRRAGKTSVVKFVASVATDILFMVSITVFALVWTVDPWMDLRGHTTPFCAFIIVRWLTIAARMIESPMTTWRGWLFMAVYTPISFVLPYYYLHSYTVFDATGELWLPWYVGMAADYTWFACLPLTSLFLHVNEDDIKAMRALEEDSSHDTLADQGSLIKQKPAKQLVWDARHVLAAWFTKRNLPFILSASAVYSLIGAALLSGIFQQ